MHRDINSRCIPDVCQLETHVENLIPSSPQPPLQNVCISTYPMKPEASVESSDVTLLT